MVKPKAELTAMTDIERIFQSSSHETKHLSQNFVNPVLAFPAVKHYPCSALVMKSKRKSLQSKGLFDFLKTLGISTEIAQYYFHEVCVYNKQTQEKLKTLGFPNEEEGFELINPFFRGTIGSQAISFIRGTMPKPESIHLFKDSLDFLSFLSKLGGKKLLADTIILHSNTCLEQINPYICNYGYKHVYSWMSNDQTGQQAKAYIQNLVSTEEESKHKPMNMLYAACKDLSKWYQQQLQNKS
ncbi:hypothetical protein [Emticicia sp. BO119]|uniref:hypothetical protein n=1 Tax=Emticicia sp. BO119 TaxID=2757768 RepID=UPI0015F0D5EC|nr:hypothetical protein [Emticicia sp. BO119]MBA4853765.1 hypothetical protein [Emticicia sp. BO119]